MAAARSVRQPLPLTKLRVVRVSRAHLSVADFSEFLKVIASQKSKTAAMDDESDTGASAVQPADSLLPVL